MDLFCRALPKCELHAHLHGSLRMSTLAELLVSSGGDDKLDASARALLTNLGSRSLSDCFSVFKLIHSAVQNSAAVCRILREVLEDFEADNARYIELRTTPRALHESFSVVSGEGEWSQWARPLLDINPSLGYYVAVLLLAMAAEEAQRALSGKSTAAAGGIVARLLLSLNRTDSFANWSAIADLTIAAATIKVPAAALAEQYPYLSAELEDALLRGGSSPSSFGPYVVGIDVSGDPTRGDITPLLPLLDKVRSAGHRLRTSVHVAETLNVREAEAVLDFRPDRLGHACVLAPSSLHRLLEPVYSRKAAESESRGAGDGDAVNTPPSLPSFLPWTARKQAKAGGSGGDSPVTPPPLESPIPIELCPTSNSLTLSLPGLEHHPTLSPWLETDYPFAICTDDSTVFGVTLSSEYALVQRAMDLSHEQLARLALRSFEFAFADEATVLAPIKAKAKADVEALLMAATSSP